MACNAETIVPINPTFPPTPADFGKPTGSSPMSGDWSAQTDFGKIAFTVDPDGVGVTVIFVELRNWTCGNVTTTTGNLAIYDPPSSIDNGHFSGSVNLSDNSYIDEIDISGTYDQTNDKFFGNWKHRAYETTCTGTWETASRK